MKDSLVYVLIINWNGVEHLHACFQSLLRTTYGNVRFLLIDNASTDGSVSYVRDTFGGDPRVEVLECPRNLGWGGGNNEGMRYAIGRGAEYVFLLNNDTATAPDAVACLVDAARRRPEAGALAPKMLLFSQGEILNSVGLACSLVGASWDIGIGRIDGPRWDVEQQVIGVCGGAAFYRTEALKRAGLLPDDFGIYYDDLDLSLRLWDAGYEIWSCPTARVWHKYSATMGQDTRLRRKHYLHERNRLRVLLRNFPASRLPTVLARYLVGELRGAGRAVLDRTWWKVAVQVRALAGGLAYLPRAMAFRRRRSRRGACRFWDLLCRDHLFFPGIALPEQGWYSERVIDGTTIRPMAAHAWRDVPAGRLRVVGLNCYPRLGATMVEILLDGSPLGLLKTCDRQELVFDLPAGRLEFIARRIFDAEATGEQVDLGGWLALDWL